MIKETRVFAYMHANAHTQIDFKSSAAEITWYVSARLGSKQTAGFNMYGFRNFIFGFMRTQIAIY